MQSAAYKKRLRVWGENYFSLPSAAPRRAASATHFKPSRAMAINQLHITYSSQILLTYNYAHTGLAGNSQRAQPTSRCASSKIQTLFHSKLVRPACRAGHTGGPAGRGTAAAAVAAAAGQAATLYQSVQQYYITQYCNHPGQQPSSSSSSSPILPMLFSALQWLWLEIHNCEKLRLNYLKWSFMAPS